MPPISPMSAPAAIPVPVPDEHVLEDGHGGLGGDGASGDVHAPVQVFLEAGCLHVFLSLIFFRSLFLSSRVLIFRPAGAFQPAGRLTGGISPSAAGASVAGRRRPWSRPPPPVSRGCAGGPGPLPDPCCVAVHGRGCGGRGGCGVMSKTAAIRSWVRRGSSSRYVRAGCPLSICVSCFTAGPVGLRLSASVGVPGSLISEGRACCLFIFRHICRLWGHDRLILWLLRLCAKNDFIPVFRADLV